MAPSKNDGKPRGRTTAYNYFMQACRDEHKRNFPDQRLSMTEASKKCSERWKVSLPTRRIFFFCFSMVIS
jgi:hypothetical protein